MKIINMNNTSISLVIIMLLMSIINIPGFEFLQKTFLFSSLFLSFFIFVTKVFRQKVRIKGTEHVFLCLMALMLFSFASIIFSNHQYLSVSRWMLVFLSSFFFLVIVASDERPYLSLDASIKILVLIASALSTYGVLIHFFGNIKGLDGEWVGSINILGLEFRQCLGEGGRICSLTSNPNSFASLFVFSIPCIMYLFYQSKVPKIYLFFSLFIMISALLLTGSRASLIATIIAFFFYILTRYRNTKSLLIQLILLIVLLVSILPYLAPLISRGGAGLSGRKDAWVLLFENFNSNLFFGSGFGVSSESVLQTGGVSFSGHNIYLTLLSEVGLLGFLFFIALLCIFLYGSSRLILHSDNRLSNIGSLVFAINIALIFHQFFETILFRASALHFIWLFFSLNGIVLYKRTKFCMSL